MTKRDAKDHLIVALDGPMTHARYWGLELEGVSTWVKVGMTLYYESGPLIVKELKELGHNVFLDLKLNDIPAQVAGAAYNLGALGVGMITVHASGGEKMMRMARNAALQGAKDEGHDAPIVLAVTVLTSMDDEALSSIGVNDGVESQVARLASLAKSAGLDGVVCSAKEVSLVSEIMGEGAYIVTPGIRLEDDENNDQARVMTPTEAIKAGATHLVVGRPITHVSDKSAKYYKYLAAIEEGLA